MSICKQSDNVYLNVVINNNLIKSDGTIDESFINGEYNVTKTLPIIDKCSDYYCSIIRFDIPLQEVPIFIMPIVPASNALNPQPNPNLTPMIIGITYLGNDYPQNIIYSPDNSYSPPTQNVIGTQVVTPYYFVYTFQNLINSINIALSAAITASGFVLPAGILPPYFYLDPSTQLINFIVPNEFTTGLNHPQIFLNSILLKYLEALPVNFLGLNQNNGKDFVFRLDNPTYNQTSTVSGTKPSPVIIPPSRPDYWKFTQEYSVLNHWSSIRKIIISTNTIPIVNEFIPAQDNNSGIATSFPIITDFVPNIEFAGQSRSIAYYYPQSQYRLVDMISDTPLYKINLKLYWEDTISGSLFPILLPRYQEANIKIAFLRKTLYKPLNQLVLK